MFNLSIDINIAVFVFPNPVGRMIRQFFFFAVFNIVSWYSLGVKFFMLYISRLRNAGYLYVLKRESIRNIVAVSKPIIIADIIPVLIKTIVEISTKININR